MGFDFRGGCGRRCRLWMGAMIDTGTSTLLIPTPTSISPVKTYRTRQVGVGHRYSLASLGRGALTNQVQLRTGPCVDFFPEAIQPAPRNHSSAV